MVIHKYCITLLNNMSRIKRTYLIDEDIERAIKNKAMDEKVRPNTIVIRALRKFLKIEG